MRNRVKRLEEGSRMPEVSFVNLLTTASDINTRYIAVNELNTIEFTLKLLK